jgi:transposase InsO family protein
VAPNQLNQVFTADRPDQIWLTDITYVPTAQGWLYLAVVLDLYSRRIVGWAMSDSLHRQLVIDALQMAITIRQPPPGLLHHSDRGSQYASDEYQALLTQTRMVGTVPVSRKGNCYDNAPVESFFGTLKTELVFHQQYATQAEARQDIFEYIEVFYNRFRRHSALGYKSPVKYEALPVEP